jgi:hypothetical protein
MVITTESPHSSPRVPTVVLLEKESSLGLCRVRLSDRFLARLRTASLDRQLAGGTSPDSDVLLALHAARLYRPAQRRRLAAGIRALSSAASGSRRTRAPIDRQSIRRVLAELEALAGRLEADGPINVSGMARVRMLLGDGAGPLYRRTSVVSLQRELVAVLAACETND